MSHPKYLPALRTEARDLGLARLSVRAADDRELGKLVGFVIDPRAQTISSLVLEVPDGTGSQRLRCRWFRCASMPRATRCD